MDFLQIIHFLIYLMYREITEFFLKYLKTLFLSNPNYE